MTRRGRWLTRGNAEDGAQLVEFALVLPLLLLIMLGIAEFGFVFQRYEVLTNAAREGARVAVLPGYNDVDVNARIMAYLTSGRVPKTLAPRHRKIYGARGVPRQLSGPIAPRS